MSKLTEAKTLFPAGGYAPAGHYRVREKTPGGHPADGMCIDVSFGDGAYGAYGTLINPQSFDKGGPEWVCRYGNIVSIRYAVAGLLESYDYLLSSEITMAEATRRLRFMRGARRSALAEGEKR